MSNLRQRLARWLVAEVPPELAYCEFECRRTTCGGCRQGRNDMTTPDHAGLTVISGGRHER